MVNSYLEDYAQYHTLSDIEQLWITGLNVFLSKFNTLIRMKKGLICAENRM